MHLPWVDGQTDRSSGRCQGICDGDNVGTEVCSLSNASLLAKSSTSCGFSCWRSGRRYLLPWSLTICKKYCLKIPIWNEASIHNVHSIKICRVLVSFTCVGCIAWVKRSMISRSLHHGRASSSRELNRSVNLSRDTSIQKRAFQVP